MGNKKLEVRSGKLKFHFLLLTFYFLFACAATGNIQESKKHIIENVPFYPQETDRCGPASLAGVMNYLNIDVTAGEVSEEIYSESARGTLDVDMVVYPQKKGLIAGQYSGGMEDLKNNIDSGFPLIVLVDYGFSILQSNHFMVVIGYNEHGVIVNSGRDKAKFIPEKDFIKSWKRTKFWTLLIKRK
ncbi:MAG: C39 family peptidase [Nitrospirae bacterium]|nr:C39 family peptidase [Nitrospirota bacterium]